MRSASWFRVEAGEGRGGCWMGSGPEGEDEEGEERSLWRERREDEGEIRLIACGGGRWSFVEVRWWRYVSVCGIGLEIVGRSDGFCELAKGLTKANRDAESFEEASPRSSVLGRMRGAIVTCQS